MDLASACGCTNTGQQNILTEKQGNVAIVTLNRPKALNALSGALIQELLQALKAFDKDDDVGAIIITGNERAFCAGADIAEQKALSFTQAYNTDYLRDIVDSILAIHKPIIGVVNGYALGGGCELAMMCDIVYAGEKAVFGQPEIKLGTIPGAGGTQRLIRAIGKAKAMHMILTGENMSATEAEKAGLVAKVLPVNEVLPAAIKAATTIAGYSRPVVAIAKEAVNEAEELGLRNGLHFERRLYHSTFALSDHQEGFGAFLEKRQPQWKHV
ncbi:enoyl-CoA hydratase carnithine racemase [Coniophora puteana RWD-64-598 SS2]|uniref:Probable enoyl-CoA hydratase, mitochondrial n=1 Tax=Coniophora puteana (strain RWD-64-598) TaxID=741705 RepID=A0A5M3MQF9_CONPW|nr:enoyl-CoA hydratase carnithine racemase [Coniophora puteana RWD-64-598 SS2]EIW81422.1 enoyl-CoA hydratase carnithine racemase [Coniophora puteana RWD-64-598 SS2]